MPTRPPRPCSRCGAPAVAGGKCERHKAQQHERTDQQRGSATERGYGKRHRSHFRAIVLARDPECVIPGCPNPSEHADHYPRTRRELVDLSLDPDNPDYGRGLCAHHHNQHTALSNDTGRNLRH